MSTALDILDKIDEFWDVYSEVRRRFREFLESLPTQAYTLRYDYILDIVNTDNPTEAFKIVIKAIFVRDGEVYLRYDTSADSDCIMLLNDLHKGYVIPLIDYITMLIDEDN